MVEGSPDEKPIFADPARAAEAHLNPSAQIDNGGRVFDDELRSEDPEAPTLGVRNRHIEIARRAARGEANWEIAEALGYTQAWISTIMHDPFVQAEIKRHRDALMETDAMSRLKLLAPDAVERIGNAIRDPKDKGGLDAAKFALEMTYGKPRQAIAVENGSLTAFTEMLNAMRKRGETIDVTPGPVAQALGTAHAAPQQDEFDTWIDKNRPAPAVG